MKITEENKNDLFIEFCDMEANEELCMSKDAFKEAITKALTLTNVGVSETEFFCEGKYDNGGDGCKEECNSCKNL